MNRRTLIPLVVLLLASAAILHAQSGNSASISGVLRTGEGISVVAFVRLGRTSPTPMSPVHVATDAKTGAFSFSGLTAGTYELCATVIGGGYVDPCLWENTGLIVKVAGGQTVADVAFTVKQASMLRVRINDPGKLVKNTPDASVLLGVMASGGRFHPLVRRTTDGTGYDYELSVPFDKPFQFIVKPIGLQLVDGVNASVETGASAPMIRDSSARGVEPAVVT